MWMPPGCGGPWAAFNSGAVEAHTTREYQEIKGDEPCEGPMVMKAPGQLPSLPSPKSGPGQRNSIVSIVYVINYNYYTTRNSSLKKKTSVKNRRKVRTEN